MLKRKCSTYVVNFYVNIIHSPIHVHTLTWPIKYLKGNPSAELGTILKVTSQITGQLLPPHEFVLVKLLTIYCHINAYN